MLLLVVGIAAVWVGCGSIARSHYYYRRAVFKKTLIEDRLGLTRPLAEYDNHAATLAIGTTQTQADVEPILRSTDTWLHRKTRFRSVVGNLRIFFGLMGFLHAPNLIWQVLSVIECPCISASVRTSPRREGVMATHPAAWPIDRFASSLELVLFDPTALAGPVCEGKSPRRCGPRQRLSGRQDG